MEVLEVSFVEKGLFVGLEDIVLPAADALKEVSSQKREKREKREEQQHSR